MLPVSIENISVSYKNVKVIDALSLEIRPGELLSILGPSGCGKTTLLRAIAGFVDFSGRLCVDGQNMSFVPPHRRNMGVVFQDYALFPHKSVMHNIEYGLKMRGMPARERTARAMDAVRMLQLEAVAHRYPAQLSGGQQQRVALARAIAIDPKVLLLDESLSALDKKLREQMQLELRQIQRRLGITTVFVTHDQEEAISLSDRVVIMRDGAIEQIGSPEELYFYPHNCFVATFLGRTNLMSVDIVPGRPRGVLRTESGLVLAPAPEGGEQASNRQGFVSLRPECLRLSLEPAASGQVDSVNGTVEQVAFMGQRRTVYVRLVSGELWEVCEAVGHRQAHGCELQAHTSVSLHWSSADVRFFND